MVILFLVLLFALLLYLVYVKSLNIRFHLDSNTMDMRLSMSWLRLFHIDVERIQYRTRMTFYIGKAKMASIFMKKGKKPKNIADIKALSLHDTCVITSYGFHKPDTTGLFYGAVIFLGSFIETEIEQHPDFIPSNEYLLIEATSNLNMGKTMVNWIKLKQRKRRLNFGSV